MKMKVGYNSTSFHSFWKELIRKLICMQNKTDHASTFLAWEYVLLLLDVSSSKRGCKA